MWERASVSLCTILLSRSYFTKSLQDEREWGHRLGFALPLEPHTIHFIPSTLQCSFHYHAILWHCADVIYAKWNVQDSISMVVVGVVGSGQPRLSNARPACCRPVQCLNHVSALCLGMLQTRVDTSSTSYKYRQSYAHIRYRPCLMNNKNVWKQTYKSRKIQ